MGLTDQMTREPRRRRPVLLGAVVLVAVVAATVGLTVLVTGGGGDSGGESSSGGQPVLGASPPSPSAPAPQSGTPSPAPSAAAATLGGRVVLPAPAATSPHGMPLGFPPTTEGAVSAIVRWAPLVVAVNEERQITLLGEVGTEEFLRTTIPAIRASYRTHPLPPSFWMESTPVAHAVVSAGVGTAEVAVLSRVQRGDASGASSSGLEVEGYRMSWSGSDWRIEETLFEFSGAHAPEVPPSQSSEDLRAAGWKEHFLA